MLSTQEALELIRQNKSVAVVGLSPKDDRPSHRVGKFLLERGFKVIPVNPAYDTVLEQKCVNSLGELSPGNADWIDLFVNKNRLGDLIDDIIRLNPKLVWCQIGVVDEAFNQALAKAGIPFIADVCPKMEWEKVND